MSSRIDGELNGRNIKFGIPATIKGVTVVAVYFDVYQPYLHRDNEFLDSIEGVLILAPEWSKIVDSGDSYLSCLAGWGGMVDEIASELEKDDATEFELVYISPAALKIDRRQSK